MTSAAAKAKARAAADRMADQVQSVLDNPRGMAIAEMALVLELAKETADVDRAVFMLLKAVTVYAKTCQEMVEANLPGSRDDIVDAAAVSLVITLQNARAEAGIK